ncbi:hypothetical protein EOD42_16830 [Rhodovarius crocodyli]|uniref:Phage neck terminator protein gp12-like domain-containing protein n=1 Tax=Rhodovarius crocodyli TaxID=1979269 RepID=A0A437MC81_9PROT|nr:hypothetical protein [Rhodovarius crocodyli]RVT95249.1 hypothetical protein EOD42_16830 [Rhodovarius crocodyli]
MPTTISLTETQILTVLRSFLLAVLPSGTEVVRGQTNRVPEPIGPDFVVMTPIMRERLATNETNYHDAALTGSATGQTLDVTAVDFGEVVIGAPLYGPGIPAGIYVSSFGTGTGGVGTYNLNAPIAPVSGDLFAGTGQAMQATRVTVQIDVHGPLSGDNAQLISTLLRSDYACQFFADQRSDVAPLYASDPRQAPFLNGEKQIETRWTLDAVLQANPVVTTPQQFAGEVVIDLNPLP